MNLFLWKIVKNAMWIGGYRGELSFESPKVPFHTAISALLFPMIRLYLHKNLFFKARFFPNWVINDIFKKSLNAAAVCKVRYFARI